MSRTRFTAGQVAIPEGGFANYLHRCLLCCVFRSHIIQIIHITNDIDLKSEGPDRGFWQQRGGRRQILYVIACLHTLRGVLVSVDLSENANK